MLPAMAPIAPIAFIAEACGFCDAANASSGSSLGADATEGFYGLGEWFEGINHRGKLRPMQIEPDLTVDSVTSENHVTTPFLIGSRG